MLHRLRRRLRVLLGRALRLWRLSGVRVCAYRLRLADASHLVERVIDVRLVGEHVVLRDLDGCQHIIALSDVRSLGPARSVRRVSDLRPMRVVA